MSSLKNEVSTRRSSNCSALFLVHPGTNSRDIFLDIAEGYKEAGCATHLLDLGADRRVMRELLGHASIGTTEVYTLATGQRLRDIHRRCHPRP